MYSGNMVWSNIATGLVVALVIICTLMPIWPAAAKHVLWYCSVTFLIIIFVLLLMRGLSFVVMWLLGYEFWVFPRLFDESLSFQDSFVPIYTFDNGTPGQGYFRLGAVAMLIGFVYWACTQPTEFDGYIKAQKVFIEDLYSGNLLADVAHDATAHLDRNKRVPSLEDLLKAMEADEKEKIGGSDGDGDSLSDNISDTLSSEEGDSLLNGEWVNVDPASAGSAKEARESREREEKEKEAAEQGEHDDAEEAEWTAPDYDQE
jgi:translocation protein SEC62